MRDPKGKAGGLKYALGGRNFVGLARINFDSMAQCACEALVARLNNMVVVLTIQVFDMQRNARSLGQRPGTIL